MGEGGVEKWEYLTQFLTADVEAEGVREELRRLWPSWEPRRYSPQALIPKLNRFGEQGWELVSIEPVTIGTNDDVLTHHATGIAHWSNVYFCTFKRRKGV